MGDLLVLPLSYQGEELEFGVRVYQLGYIQRVEVWVEDIAVQFELDDEGNYRALVSPEQRDESKKKLSVGLLQAIALQLESINPKS
ncbi:hypothetical protein ACPPVU_11775 [Mucilaginibacter sp. McL0603]|uniref:hypothetical protein n=1 Tax=Mucilaginibacter sp. McL0603 TaxID=3415670 RepID=UPI003CF49983